MLFATSRCWPGKFKCLILATPLECRLLQCWRRHTDFNLSWDAAKSGNVTRDRATWWLISFGDCEVICQDPQISMSAWQDGLTNLQTGTECSTFVKKTYNTSYINLKGHQQSYKIWCRAYNRHRLILSLEIGYTTLTIGPTLHMVIYLCTILGL